MTAQGGRRGVTSGVSSGCELLGTELFWESRGSRDSEPSLVFFACAAHTCGALLVVLVIAAGVQFWPEVFFKACLVFVVVVFVFLRQDFWSLS